MIPNRLTLPTAFFFLINCINVSASDELGRHVVGTPVTGGEERVLSGWDKNITAAYLQGDPDRKPIPVTFNPDATRIALELPAGDGGRAVLELAEGTEQFADGRIVLSALDAKVEGEAAKLESHPGNHRIGFWNKVGDVVTWEYAATRPGMYDVEVTYSLAGSVANEVEFSLGTEKVKGTLEPTGSWYRYTVARFGRVYIEKKSKLEATLRGLEMKGGALMNLKAVTLRPAPEGDPVTQSEDGVVELDSSVATVHSTLMQYERKETKRCLGYWAKPQDWASFDFSIKKAGTFKIELTQGCGKGHGGSEVEVVVGGKRFDFTVDDTGGFQNWKVRELGEVTFHEPGEQRLEIRPKNKQGVAVMDVRRVRLVPVD